MNIKWTATNLRKGMWLTEESMNTILSEVRRGEHRRVLPVVTRVGHRVRIRLLCEIRAVGRGTSASVAVTRGSERIC